MQLKRNGVGEGWITRKAAGLCFDFLPSDPSSYLAGTEDGSVHHCSIAYNEQYLSTFERSSGGGAAAHDGPVHRVSFSPHWPELFLTCSADWTLSLFHTKQKTGLLSMHATGEDHGVNDICWCPGNSTLFASVTATAKLQIWDLSVSCIDPVINVDTNTFDDGSERDDQATQVPRISSTESRPNTSAFGAEEKEGKEKGAGKESTPVSKLIRNLATIAPARGLTCVRFGEKSPIVVVGDNKGVVSVFRLMHPIAITHEGPLQQSEKLKKSIISQTDPEKAARLLDIINKQTNTLSSSISAISPTPASPAVDEEAIVPPPLPPVPAVVEFKSQ